MDAEHYFRGILPMRESKIKQGGCCMKQTKKDILAAMLMTWIIPGILLGLLHMPDSEEMPLTAQPQVTRPIAERTITVLTKDGLRQMEMTAYLTGVLLCEMPESFSLEAKKAQAVVARTYALKTVLEKGKHPADAVCTDPSCCQGYTAPEAYAGSQWGIEQAKLAATQTAREVLLYRDELIDATYFSCSGGKTEAAVAVWGTDVPYLQSVESPGEESAAYYEDTEYFTAEQFARALSVQLTGEPASWITGVVYTQGGGIANVTVCGKTFTGRQLRSLLGLRSTNISMKATADGVTVETKGFGHRVGMSQYGAQAMSEAGNTYQQILAHYYVGANIGEYDS